MHTIPMLEPFVKTYLDLDYNKFGTFTIQDFIRLADRYPGLF